jgi:hypothetical protein
MKTEDLPQRILKTFLPKRLAITATKRYKFLTADCLIVSYPKSDRTWLRVMLSEYFVARYDLPAGSLIEFANFHYMDSQIPKIYFTHDIRNTLLTPAEVVRDRSVYHNKRLVFVVRDPRDVVVSMYFQRTRRDENFDGSMSDYVFGSVGGFETLLCFYKSWMETLPNISESLLLKYEEMKSSPELALSSVLTFMGFDPDPASVHVAVQASTFDQMKKKEANNEYGRTWLEAGNPDDKESFKVRKGKVGGYRDYLSESEIDRMNIMLDTLLPAGLGYTAGQETTN